MFKIRNISQMNQILQNKFLNQSKYFLINITKNSFSDKQNTQRFLIKKDQPTDRSPNEFKRQYRKESLFNVSDKSQNADEDFKPKILKSVKKDNELEIQENFSFSEYHLRKIFSSEKTPKKKDVFGNSSISDLLREYSNIYIDSLKRKYNSILKDLIKEKISNLEKEISKLKENYSLMKNSNENLEDSSLIENINKNLTEYSLSASSFFDLKKFTLKDIEEKISNLPNPKKDSEEFCIEYSYFYLNINIDKSFEIFKEKLYGKKLNNNLVNSASLFIQKFIARLIELDRLIYLPNLMVFSELNNIKIKLSDKTLNHLESTISNYISKEIKYKSVISIYSLFNLVLTHDKSESTKKIIRKVIENSFVDIINYKISNRILHKYIYEDEILSSNYLLSDVIIPFNNNKIDSSVSKLFSCYLDDTNFIKLILEKYIMNKPTLISNLKVALQSNYDNFGFLPNGFNHDCFLDFYYSFSRARLNNSGKNLFYYIEEFDLTYYIIKCHNLMEVQADLITISEKIFKIHHALNHHKFHLSDFVINNSIEEKNFYYKLIDSIYNEKINIHGNDFADQLLFSTLANLKDGSKQNAIKILFGSLQERIDFVKNNDKELMDLIKNIKNLDKLKKDGFLEQENLEGDLKNKETILNIDSDFIPFIEKIKSILTDLINYKMAFETNNNILLAKENILDKLLKKDQIIEVNSSLEKFYLKNFKEIIINLDKIKDLSKKKEIEKIENLKSSIDYIEKKNYKKYLDYIKCYIYSRFDEMDNILKELSKNLNISLTSVEDIENLSFSDEQDKYDMICLIEDCKSSSVLEKHTYQKLYSNFYYYVLYKPLLPVSDAVVTEDMLEFLDNPEIILDRKIDYDSYQNKAKNYFSQYYKQKTKNLKKNNLFVLENLDFIRNNLKIYFDNYLIQSFDNGSQLETERNLQEKIKLYEKNLNVIKKITSKIPDFNLDSRKILKMIPNKNDRLLKQLILFESEKTLRVNKLKSTTINFILHNKPNHLIEKFIKGFTNIINNKMQLKLSKKDRLAKKVNKYPFSNINNINLFNYLHSLNVKNNSNIKNEILTNLSEKLIVPRINSKKSAIYKNILSQINLLENSFKGQNVEKNHNVNELYEKILSVFNISINKTIEDNKLSAEETKKEFNLKEMKKMTDQEFVIFDLSHCIYMIDYGIKHNIPEAIRLAEKICSDFRYVLPSNVVTKVNKYLINHGKDYALVAENIYPVELSRIYGNSDKDKSIYDEYDLPSYFSIDKLPFNGLEKIYDAKKFNMMIRHINLKN